jgi:adenosylmethionine-8-amino-7-oxononanoate aminotransferase
MSHILYRHTKIRYPQAVRGEGVYLFDENGKDYLDASSGAAVSCLGHGHPKVIEAIKAQLDQMAYAHSGFFTNEASEKLADFLIEKAPGDLSRVYFLSGGSEANETALKLARQYFVEIGETKRHRFVARQQSYHGNTLGALSVGGNLGRRELFGPILLETSHISPCFYLRYHQEGESETDFGQRVADELEAEILRLGPETVAAFIAEPVVGATLGAVPPVAGYLRRIREICDRYGVLLIFDEVMCGMGRTGTRYACEQEGVAPDILTCAKGLGGGYQPIGAALLCQKIYDAIEKGSGFFQHGFTYIGHATACRAGLAVQDVIEEEGLLAQVEARGNKLEALLQDALGQHPHVGDLRGRGLFRGIELVQDRETLAPFDPALKLPGRLRQAAMDEGLVCYPGGGTVDGKRGDHILLAPPFIISEEELGVLVERLCATIDKTLAAN